MGTEGNIILKRKNFAQIKSEKPFRSGDVLIYSALLLIISVLFAVFIIFPSVNASDSTGFEIEINGKTVCTFTYADKKLTVNDGFVSLVEYEEAENGLKITVFTSSEKEDFNELFADFSKKTVKVTDSNCSVSKDCVFSPAISNSGAIYCAPHGLKIVPLGNNGFTPPITG